MSFTPMKSAREIRKYLSDLVSKSENLLPSKPKPPRQPPIRRPTCTHIVMGKEYGTNERCHVCDRYPSLGWLYVCQQDARYPIEKPEPAQPEKRLSASDLPADASSLELLGCHKTVVDGANAGDYTVDQVKILIRQKINVRDTIAAQLAQEKANAIPKSPGQSPKMKAGKLKKEDAGIKEPAVLPVAADAPCHFKCCPHCRPLSRDRAVSSFESVLGEPNQLSKPWDPHTQPVAKASILANMNPVGIPESDVSTGFGSLAANDSDVDVLGFSATRGYPSYIEMVRSAYSHHNLDIHDTQEEVASRGFRGSWKKSLDDMLRSRQAASRGIDLARGTRGNSIGVLNENEAEYQRGGADSDLQLFKRLSDEVQREASTITLPNADGDSFQNVYDPYGIPHSEKHVRGGVAVTEEAIENEAPDIITTP